MSKRPSTRQDAPAALTLETNAVSPVAQRGAAGPKTGAQRTTKNAQKLKLLPEGQRDESDLEDVDDNDIPVYTQIAQIPSGTARKDALRLSKAMRSHLPRVTAYCTAS